MNYSRIIEAREFIKRADPRIPSCVVVMGSGLGFLADDIKDAALLNYSDIPGFPRTSVEGHTGHLMIGSVEGKICALMHGRFHRYEGHSIHDIVFPIRTLLGLGAGVLITTNAAGGINPSFAPGDLMLITDHINFTGDNPLIGPNEDALGPRFPDMSEPYSKLLMERARSAATHLGIDLKEGVYAGVLGPCYETSAEIRMLRAMGADAVGMSTVAEVIAARHMGAEVLGISCITNSATGVQGRRLSHKEVIETAERMKIPFSSLLKVIIGGL